MRVLVTGSHGFVGRWLVAYLEAEGDEVIGIDLNVDITEADAIRAAIVGAAPQAICHLAARASVAASWGSQNDTYRVNTQGSLHILQAAVACQAPPRVLLISSSEVYGRVKADELPLREDHPFEPISPYAASKAAAEVFGLQAWLGNGLEVVRARPFNHTGPGQRPDFVVPALAKQIADASRTGSGELRTGNLDARRDLSDVRDVVRAYRELLVSGVPGEVYNVCSGSAFSIRAVAELMLSVAGADLEIVVDPTRVRSVEIPELRGDRSKLEAATGWVPEIPLERTLADVISYWQQQPPG